MIRESVLKQYGFKISVSEINKKLCANRICEALKREGLNVAVDNEWLYVIDDTAFKRVADKVNNQLWLCKIARHRIYEDCKGCKFLDEDSHLGKAWCKKWDTDIWNVSTPFPDGKNVVNKGCVPFRYFGYAPDNPERQTQFNLKSAGLGKGSEILNDFLQHFDLYDVGQFTDENTFYGEFDPVDKFGLKFDPNTKTITLAIQNPHSELNKEYSANFDEYKQMISDWRQTWGVEEGHELKVNQLLDKKAYDPKLNTPRQERNFDWTNREEYKRKHNPQQTKQYDISPSNTTGDKYNPLSNSAGESDKDVGNLL